MLDLLDNLLRQIFMDGVAGLQEGAVTVSEDQIRFQPPDDQWRAYVNNLQRNALNVYLVDLRENRKLRSNERVRSIANGFVYEEPAPARLDCHYLISAQSPAVISDQVEPTLDEHALLYETAGVLFQNAPLNPSSIYPEGSAALNAWPERFRESDLPAIVAPVEGFGKLPEFWSSMGEGARWKPAVYLIVSLPVALIENLAGPMVTTRITEYRVTGLPETTETFVQIGGHVLDATGAEPAPVEGAWVQLESATSEVLDTTQTDELGRFTFERLQPGQYQLRWSAVGFPLPPGTRQIDVPSQTGEYDLTFV